LLAQALATSIDSTGFFSIKGPEILSKWVGDSEEAIRQFFNAGRLYFQKTGKKAVLFVDEADALLQKRGRSGGAAFMSDTIVPQFLTEMNGLEASSTIVVLATNRPDSLDPAVVREGRISEKIHIKRPDQAVGKEIMKSYLLKRPLADDIDSLAGSAIQVLFSTNLAKMKKDFIHAGHYLSGALCAGIVEKAAGHAYHRQVGGSPQRGIILPDIEQAAKTVSQGLRDLDHSDIIYEHGLQ
jgi:SpoVK/Ycf46/Vps4 family AAA+-type ATPase